jgi:hypothetical protein
MPDFYWAHFSGISGITRKDVIPRGLNIQGLINDLEETEEATHIDYSTVGLGAFSTGAGGEFARELREISMDFLITDYGGRFAALQPGVIPMVEDDIATISPAPVPLASSAEKELRGILRARTPVALVVIAQDGSEEFAYKPETGGGVTIRSISRTRRAGNPGALWLTVAFKEWRNPQKASATSNVGFSSGDSGGTKLPTTYTSRSGGVIADTLESISKKFYGTYTDWRVIASANNLTGKYTQGSVLPSGLKLKIPERPTSSGGSQVPNAASRK